MGMDIKELNKSLDNNDQWRSLLKEARYLGITPEEIRAFLEMARTIELSKWRQNEQDNQK